MPSGTLPALSGREQELSQLAGAALQRPDRRRADLSVQTVKSHVAAILLKLGVHDRTQAVIAAYETGFVVPGSSP